VTLQTGELLTIREVAETRQAWLAALAGSRELQVQLDAAALTSVDTAGVQLVLALRRECQTQGGHLALAPAGGVLADGMSRLALGPLAPGPLAPGPLAPGA
jgi:ABC-type transporter Mla MlaB component